MTLPLRICFSLLMAWPAATAPVAGSVRLSDSVAPAVRRRQDFSGVVVWLEPVHPLQMNGHADGRPPGRARMEQKDKRFVPHVLAIPVGAEVDFPNFDPIFHSAFSNFSGQVFDLGLYPPGTSRTITFTRTGVVRVFCNIHPTMSATIVVLKSPWFAVSDAAGRFSVANVPAGEYHLHVFHERATSATLQALERTIEVPARGLTLAPLSISETGYLEAPHKNKYGLDYPPASEERNDYPSHR
jgi:plastocyanin